ncbi:arginase [Vibrio sp. NTOU-M3]|uniref:arginase n=1 Tax=Vibrio sp. NTOU-M3 TaxID=3234954 RepID=UPI00349FACF7
MLGLFKRIATHGHAPYHHHGAVLLTVCESYKPMTLVEFEFAEQALESVADWLYPGKSSQPYCLGTHFVLSDHQAQPLQNELSARLGNGQLPVVLTNAHETVLHVLPLISYARVETGIVSIGNDFQLKQSLEPQLGSAYHFALARFSESRLFSLGIDPSRQKEIMLEYAEDQGCNWMTNEECNFRHRFQLKNLLGGYIGHCDQLIIDIDLESLLPKNGVDSNQHLNVQMVLRMIRQCMMSGKVKYVQLVGCKDKHIYSRATKLILDNLATMMPSRPVAA